LRLAIVIPTLDEEEILARHLPAALAEADQVIVSDGGSTDRTGEVARAHGVPVVGGEAGRGGQLNRGAAAADADVLLFLHADTTLPAGARRAVLAAIAGGAVGGAFLLRFLEDRPMLRLGAALINRRTRWLRIPLGDQAQFVHRDAFAALGGFRDWPILEDLDFFGRLKRHGSVAILEGPVATSGRRFLTRGPLRTVATNWLIWGLFFLGVSPHRLSRLYRHIR
jgi:rSAM/selenodomain-associated transferase 2